MQANCNECRYYHDAATFTSVKTVLRSPGLQFTLLLRAKASENTFATVLLKGHFLKCECPQFRKQLNSTTRLLVWLKLPSHGPGNAAVAYQRNSSVLWAGFIACVPTSLLTKKVYAFGATRTEDPRIADGKSLYQHLDLFDLADHIGSPIVFF